MTDNTREAKRRIYVRLDRVAASLNAGAEIKRGVLAWIAPPARCPRAIVLRDYIDHNGMSAQLVPALESALRISCRCHPDLTMLRLMRRVEGFSLNE